MVFWQSRCCWKNGGLFLWIVLPWFYTPVAFEDEREQRSTIGLENICQQYHHSGNPPCDFSLLSNFERITHGNLALTILWPFLIIILQGCFSRYVAFIATWCTSTKNIHISKLDISIKFLPTKQRMENFKRKVKEKESCRYEKRE